VRSVVVSSVGLLVACSGDPRPALRSARVINTRTPATVTLLGGAHDEALQTAPGLSGASGTRFLAGGLRAEVTVATVALSDARLGAPLAAAVEVADGWLWLSRDGALSASDHFTSAMRPLGRAAGLVRTSSWSRGRLSVITREGAFTSTGRALAPVRNLPAPAFEMAFADGLFGAATLVDGRLTRTHDGGDTWELVELDQDLALSVRCVGTGLVVETTRGALELSATGPLTAYRPRATEETPVSAAQLVEQALRDRVPTWSRLPSARLSDGAWVSFDRTEAVKSDARGRELRRVHLTEREVPARVERWGDAVVVRADRLYRTTDGQHFETLLPTGGEGWSGDAFALSDDGVSAALPGPCAAALVDVSDRIEAVCIRTPAGRWRDVTIVTVTPVERGVRRAMHGGLLLLGAPDHAAEGAPSLRYVVIDTAHGDVRTVIPPERARWTHNLEWTREGLLRGVVEAADDRPGPRRWMVSGPPEGPWESHAIPDGAQGVTFADTRRGVAFGRRASSLWRTLDNGGFWAAIPTPPDAAGRRFSPLPEAVCDESGCTVDDVLRVDGWGPLRDVEAHTEAPVETATPDDDTAPPTPRQLLANAPTLRCEGVGAGAPSPWRAAAGASVAWGVGVAASRPGRTGLDLAWRDDDGRAGQVSLTGSADAVILGAGAGALVARRATPPTLGWVHGASTTPLTGLLPAVPGWLEGGATAWLTLPARGGGLVALTTWGSARHIAAAFEVDAQGAVQGSRRLLPEGPDGASASLLLARRNDRWNLAYALGGGRLRVVAWDGATTDLSLSPGALRVCVGDVRPGATTLSIPLGASWGRALDLDGTPALAARVTVEASPESACVRYVRATTATAVVVARASGGILEGWRDEAATRAPLRCTLRIETAR
jgi:hypothetical protein